MSFDASLGGFIRARQMRSHRNAKPMMQASRQRRNQISKVAFTPYLNLRAALFLCKVTVPRSISCSASGRLAINRFEYREGKIDPFSEITIAHPRHPLFIRYQIFLDSLFLSEYSGPTYDQAVGAVVPLGGRRP